MARIVVGVDGTSASRVALAWALEEAWIRQASVDAVLAYPYMPVGYTADIYLDAEDSLRAHTTVQTLRDEVVAAHAELADVPMSVRVTPGDAAEVLVDAALGADLLVLGARDHGALSRAIIGSTSRHCARASTAPVVVIRATEAGAPRQILVGIDSSPASEQALRWAAAEAVLRGVPLRAVTAWQLPGTGEGLADATALLTGGGLPPEPEHDARTETLATLRRVLGHPGNTVPITLVRGHPARALGEAGGPEDMLVVGCRGMGLVQRMAHGSTSSALAARHRGVLVVVHAPAQVNAAAAHAAASPATTSG